MTTALIIAGIIVLAFVVDAIRHVNSDQRYDERGFLDDDDE